jgi:peptide/nickel transport system substrate-binding protein
MSRPQPRRRSLLVATATMAASTLLLSACGGDDDGGDASGTQGSMADSLTVGTTDKIVTLDPAGSYDRSRTSPPKPSSPRPRTTR